MVTAPAASDTSVTVDVVVDCKDVAVIVLVLTVRAEPKLSAAGISAVLVTDVAVDRSARELASIETPGNGSLARSPSYSWLSATIGYAGRAMGKPATWSSGPSPATRSPG